MPRNYNTKWQSFIIVISSTFIIYLAYISGILPKFELQFYDWLVTVRPKANNIINDIVIVGVTEKDIEELGYPITDKILAEVINKIDRFNPTVIGLDIFRNVDIGEEDNEKLDEIFALNKKLIGVEFTNGGVLAFDSIPAPTQLEEGRSAGSAAINDFDGNVRRAYLLRKKKESKEEPTYFINSFALSIASAYLEQLEILPEKTTNKECVVKLGRAKFANLEKNNFFYPPKEMDECQIFINYSSYKENFKKVSFLEILENRDYSSLLKNKIVLIGTLDLGSSDTFFIPDNIDEERNFILGVELHSIVTNQIINTALNKQKVISFPHIRVQYFYIGSWLILLAILSNKICLNSQNKKAEIISGVLIISSSIAVVLLGYGLFLAGWVVPTVTTLSIVLLNQSITDIFVRFNKIRREKEILEEKVEEKTQALKQAQKIILEQEKFKVHEIVMYHVAHQINNKNNSINLALENSRDYIIKLKDYIEEYDFWFEEDEDGDSISQNDDDSFPEVVDKLGEEILESLEQSQIIKSNISEIYQKKKGQIAWLKKIVDLNYFLINIIDKIVKDKQKQIKNLQIEIEHNYDRESLKNVCLFVDIEKALANIIDNSVDEVVQRNDLKNNFDYQPKITLTTINQGDSVLIKIKDNGRGIKPEDLNKIFDSFWTTKSMGKGLGLGLYIAKEIIERHGGSISVESEVGEWTEFSVILPLEAK